MWYIGIDVHKKMCNACIKDLEGNIQKELELRSLVRHRITLTRDMTRVKNRIHAILDYELEFKGTDMFGKAGMMWLWSITCKLTKLDQFIFDAELRHIKTLKGLIKDFEWKRE